MIKKLFFMAALLVPGLASAANPSADLSGQIVPSGGCNAGNHGLVRGRAQIAGGTMVAEDGCLIRAVSSHMDAPSDGGTFAANYGNITWWHQMHDIGHFNALRIAAYLQWGPPGGARTDSQTMANVESQLDTILSLASQVGMYVVIDCHSFPGPGGAGDNPPDWGNDQYGNATFWTTIAARYANNSNVIFEIQNEPDGDGDIAGHVTSAYNLIRSLAPNTKLITNTFNCNGSLNIIQAETAIDYTNVAASGFHPYCDANISNEMAISQQIQAAGFPVIMTEYCCGASGGGIDMNGYIAALEAGQISWFLWAAGFTDASTGITYGSDQGYGPLNITWPKD
jgi:aryl-phospho-beta-D-glucosidase BglC (GH1 family)